MKRTGAFLAVVSLFSIHVLAQTPPERPKPGPELQRLDYFVGTWTFEGEDQPSPFGPGGKFTGSETSEWYPGGFFLVSRNQMQSSMGEGQGQSVMGYSPEKKAYTIHVFNSMGEQIWAEGQVAGDTWTWTNEGQAGGKQYKGRYTMKEVSPTSYTIKLEVSTGGGPFALVMEGKATKK